MELGRVRALALRADRTTPPQRAAHAQAMAGQGFDGDIHADPFSPRQLLLASAAVYDKFDLPAQALRENLLLDIDTARLTSGTVLQLGAQARIRLMFQCEACGQLDLVRRGLAGALGARRGMLARVIAGGTIHEGDPVVQLAGRLPAWSDDWHARIIAVLDAVPPGAVVDYARLARLAGVQSSYCRAFPRFLSRLGPEYAGKALPARSTGGARRWDGAGLFDQDASTA